MPTGCGAVTSPERRLVTLFFTLFVTLFVTPLVTLFVTSLVTLLITLLVTRRPGREGLERGGYSTRLRYLLRRERERIVRFTCFTVNELVLAMRIWSRNYRQGGG